MRFRHETRARVLASAAAARWQRLQRQTRRAHASRPPEGQAALHAAGDELSERPSGQAKPAHHASGGRTAFAVIRSRLPFRVLKMFCAIPEPPWPIKRQDRGQRGDRAPAADAMPAPLSNDGGTVAKTALERQPIRRAEHRPFASRCVGVDLFRPDAARSQFGLDNVHGFRFHPVALDGNAIEQVLGRGLPDVPPHAVRIKLHTLSGIFVADRVAWIGDCKPGVCRALRGMRAS